MIAFLRSFLNLVHFNYLNLEQQNYFSINMFYKCKLKHLALIEAHKIHKI